MRLRSTAGTAQILDDRYPDENSSSGTAAGDLAEGVVDPLVVAAFDLNDPYAVNVRALRTRILQHQADRDDRRVRSSVLIGFDCDEELAVLAANLAVVMARMRTPTLLLDGTNTSPWLQDFFGQPIETELPANARGTPIPRLWIVPADGSTTPHEHRPLLDRVRDWALPSTQLVSTLALDHDNSAATIAAAAIGIDAAVLAVRQHVSAIRDVRGMIDSLDEQGVPIIGAVLV